MLQSLQIENYAIIRSIKINFDEGFTVITGETGAGKSIIIGALSLILGNRADSSVLHDRSKKCFVEATFDISTLHLQTFFDINDLDYQDTTTIRREITENGKSRAFINDTPVNLNTLRALAEQLVDIHSQHNNLLVNTEEFRIALLDQYAHSQKLLAEYRSAFLSFKKNEEKYIELLDLQQKIEQERNYLEFVFQELNNAKLSDGEQESIEQQISLLSNAEQIKNKLFNSLQLISEQEEGNILQQLKYCLDQVQNISNYDAGLADLSQRMSSCLIELKDIAEELEHKNRSIEVNPEELERLNERLDFILNLEHKHHVNNIEGLLNLMQEAAHKLSLFEEGNEELHKVEAQRQVLRSQAEGLAQQLTQQRQAAIEGFEQEMVGKIRLLGMEYAEFKVNITLREELGGNGNDHIQFLFSANRGSELNDISKTASGGEISRLMLAIKSIINDSSLLPTVIFDEIDTGISGEVASKVAIMMDDLSRQHQLIVITHLPQIAAKGKMHYFVFKNNDDRQTRTEIRCLDNEESVVEIAKMISGERVSEAALATAKELKSKS